MSDIKLRFEGEDEDLLKTIDELKNRLAELEKQQDSAKKSAEQMGGAYAKVEKTKHGFIGSVAKVGQGVLSFTAKMTIAVGKMAVVFAALSGPIIKALVPINTLISAISKIPTGINRTIDQTRKLGKNFKDIGSHTLHMIHTLGKLGHAHIFNRGSIQKHREALRGHKESLRAAQKEMSEAAKAYDNMRRNIVRNIMAANKSAEGNEKAAFSFKNLGKKIFAARKAILVWSVAIGAAVFIMSKLVSINTELADAIDKGSEKALMSAKEFQALNYVLEQNGTSMSSLERSMAEFRKQQYEAVQGAGDAADKFRELGIAIQDSEGNMRSQDAVFKDTVKSLQNIEDPLERSQKATKIFGNQARELLPLLSRTNEEIDTLYTNVDKYSLVLSDSAVVALRDLKDAQHTSSQAWTVMRAELGAKLVPVLIKVAELMTGLARILGNTYVQVLAASVAVGVLLGVLVPLIPIIVALTAKIIALTVAMMANPLFLLAMGAAAVLMGVVKAVKHFSKSSDEAKESTEELGAAVRDTAADLEQLEELFEDIRRAQRDSFERSIDDVEDWRKKRLKEFEHDAAAQYEIHAEADRRILELIRNRAEAEEAERRKAWLKIREEQNKVLNSMALDLMDSQDRETSLLKAVYNERKELFRGNAEALQELETWHTSKLAEINQKYIDEQLKAHQALQDRINSIKQAGLDFDQGINDQRIAAMTTIRRSQMSAKEQELSELETQLVQMRSLYDEFAMEQIDITMWAAQRRKEIEEQHLEELDEKRSLSLKDYVGLSQTALSSISQMTSSANNKRMSEIDKMYRDEADSIKLSRMSARARAAELEALEQRVGKEKHEQAMKEWRQSIVMSIVHTALGVAKAIPNWPMMIAAGAAGATSTGVIAANKPRFKKGLNAGFVGGSNFHSGPVDVQAEPGEAILTPSQQREFLSLGKGGRASESRNVSVGDTSIVINGNADSGTVNQMEDLLHENRQRIYEMLYEGVERNEFDFGRMHLQPSF